MFAHTNSFQSANEELKQLQQLQKTQQDQQIEQQRQLALQDSIQNSTVTPNQLSSLFKTLMEEFNQLDMTDKKALRGHFARVIANISKFRRNKTKTNLKKAHKSVMILRKRVGKKLGSGKGVNTQTPSFSQSHPHLTESIDSFTRKPTAQIFKTFMRLGMGG